MLELKTLIKSKQESTFTQYSKGYFWYVTACGYEFPIPLSDVHDAALLCVERSSALFRWINIHQSHKSD